MAITWNSAPQTAAPTTGTSPTGGGIKWDSGGLDASVGALASSQASHQQLQAKAASDQAAAKTASDAANSPAGIATETAKAIPGQAGTMLGGIANNVLRLAQSAVAVPKDIYNNLTGKPMDDTPLQNFTGGTQKTFQGQFESETMPAVASGQLDPRAATLGTVGGVVGAGLDPLGTEGVGSLLKKPLGIVGDYMAKRGEKQALTASMKAITPKLTSGEMQEAAAAGRVTTPTRGAPRVDFSGDKNYQAMANDTKGIVNGKDPNVDIHNLRTAISNTSENYIKPFLNQNKVPVNFDDFIKKLQLVQPQSGLKADPSAFKTYNRVREEVQGEIYGAMKGMATKSGDFGNSTDLNHVWDANKILDSQAERELGDKVFGSPEYTGAKAAIQDMREGIRQYIKDSIKFPGQMGDVNKMQQFMQVARSRGMDINSPEEMSALMKQMGIKNTDEATKNAAFFDDSMRRVSNFYKAVDNIKTKIPDYLRENATFAMRHPFLTKGAGWAGAGAAAGVGIGGANEIKNIAGL